MKHPHADEGPPVRTVSGRGNIAGPCDARAEERERKRAAQWNLKRYLPPKKKGLAGSESLTRLQLSYRAAQSA